MNYQICKVAICNIMIILICSLHSQVNFVTRKVQTTVTCILNITKILWGFETVKMKTYACSLSKINSIF